MSLVVRAKRRLKGFTLDVAFEKEGPGILGVLGASGCGKSMTLKCVAGLETPDEGEILAGDRTLYDSATKINLRPQQRRVGYLFQSYALFPHMRVRENILCALEGDKRQQRKAAGELMDRFGLAELAEKYPGQLSGGQQQRVALARILASAPRVLLLDEPFAALDAYLKEQMQIELLALLEGYPGDVVMVSHSRDEIYRLCPRLLVMDGGRVVIAGDTRKIFRNPRFLQAARLTGCKNLAPARRVGEHEVEAPEWGLRLQVAGPVPERLSHIGVRAHDFIPADGEPDAPNRFAVDCVERLESPFEWNVMFRKSGVLQANARLWWKYPKGAGADSMPAYFSVAPNKVLLLEEV